MSAYDANYPGTARPPAEPDDAPPAGTDHYALMSDVLSGAVAGATTVAMMPGAPERLMEYRANLERLADCLRLERRRLAS